MKKKKKNSYDPKKATFIICVIVIVIVLLNMIYDSNHYTETWIVCNNEQNKYEEYEEIVKYRFKGDKLEGFYREEYIDAPNQKSFDELYKTFKETRDSLQLSDALSYEISTNGLKLEVKTYISIANMPSFFNSYIKSTPINSSSDIEMVKEYYQEDGYECKISHK